MDKRELEKRTKAFALTVIRFVQNLPPSKVADVLGRQLLKSGTSVGANYHEANRAESRLDFHHKIALVEKEASETLYWLQLCRDVPIGDAGRLGELLDECEQLLAIFTSVGKRTRPEINGRIGEEAPYELS